ncbi:MAG: hypothetical protein P4L27_06985 [Ignavibacteriaceae bacterium]|nr:hypothetical protein [Ignavibacteriaceae bacterium]
MKKNILFILFLLTVSKAFPQAGQFSQFSPYPMDGKGNVEGGLGLNWIDGELFYSFHFRPEVSLGNFGFGLDLQLDFNSKGKFRTQDFNSFGDYLRIIRYARYGVKNDPVFIKLGAIDYYTLGHGSIIYLYNNSPSFDARRTGLVFDIDFGQFGVESIYSSFGEPSVVGIRGHVRPLKFTELGLIPIIGNLEVGATFASDYNKDASVINGSYNPANNIFNQTASNGSLQIAGVDVALPIFSNNLVGVKLYTDYSKIINFGSGVATGVIAEFNGLGIVNATAKLERRFNNARYIPSYFNSLYEIERFQIAPNTGTFTSKAARLDTIVADNGYYGELFVNVLGLVGVTGSYQRLDKDPNSGILHMATEIAPGSIPFVARAGYDKINIQGENDLFTLDDRSYLYFELGYKPYPFLLVSMVYQWTYTPMKDSDKNIIGYEPQKRIEPRITFVYPFNMQ